jgi:hypothetical protein
MTNVSDGKLRVMRLSANDQAFDGPVLWKRLGMEQIGFGIHRRHDRPSPFTIHCFNIKPLPDIAEAMGADGNGPPLPLKVFI